MAFLFGPFALHWLLALVLPWRVLLRVTFLVLLAVLLVTRLSPPVHFSDQGPFHIPESAIWGILLGPAAFILAVRVVSRGVGGVTLGGGSSAADGLIGAAEGAVGALWFFVGRAWITEGLDSAILVHLVQICLAAVFGRIAREERGVLLGVMAGMSLAQADGRPYCIALQVRQRAAEGWGDLTFLTMDKLTYPRHAILVIEGEATEDAAHCSCYRQEFRRRGGPLSALGCAP